MDSRQCVVHCWKSGNGAFNGAVPRLYPVFLKHHAVRSAAGAADRAAIQKPFDEKSNALAKTNFQYEKRQKDLEKKRKKEEKLKKKADKANQPEGTPDEPGETGDEAEDGSVADVTDAAAPAPGNPTP